MARPTRIPVYCSRQAKIPFFWIKPDFAIECLASHRAELCRDGIRWIFKSDLVPSDDSAPSKSKAYEQAAITKNRRYVVGGLTRNEHQPAAFHRFEGARVGHGP